MKNFLPGAIFFLREYLFPAGCAICGAGLVSVEETWYGICEDCRRTIARDLAETGERCDCCGRPLVSEHNRCLSCRNAESGGEKRAFDRVTALFPYTGKYRTLLQAYKFGKNLALGHFFAEQIQAAAERLAGDFALVPVPPRPGKVRKNGWDQVEYLAHLLEKTLSLSRCLKRLPSQTQKKLTREDRKKNLLGRIAAKRSPPKTAVLFDDVMTTGSTLDVCAATLKAAGAEKVNGICLFYT